MTVIERAKASNQGITLNRTAGITERLEQSALGSLIITNGNDGVRHLGNHISIWFVLHSLATVQTVYTSWLNAANLITWVQVNTDGTMVYYSTGTQGGTFRIVTLATGITTNTLYHLAMINGVIYLNGTAVYTLVSNDYNGGDRLVIGVRRSNTSTASPTTFGTGTTYSFHAHMTVFQVTTWYPTTQLTATDARMLYNNGKGMRLLRHIIGRRRSITADYLFDPANLTGGSFVSRLSAGRVTLDLIQSSFQSLQYRTRVGGIYF